MVLRVIFPIRKISRKYWMSCRKMTSAGLPPWKSSLPGVQSCGTGKGGQIPTAYPHHPAFSFLPHSFTSGANEKKPACPFLPTPRLGQTQSHWSTSRILLLQVVIPSSPQMTNILSMVLVVWKWGMSSSTIFLQLILRDVLTDSLQRWRGADGMGHVINIRVLTRYKELFLNIVRSF